MFMNLALRITEMSRYFKIFVAVAIVAVAFSSCKTDANSPGVEYMPDMYRSPALEAYVDYGNSKTLDWTELQKDAAGKVAVMSRKPAPGSIAYTGSDEAAQFAMPYPLANTTEDYERAALEIHSPMKSTKANIEAGMAVYAKMCVHCHGEAGQGDGAISKNGHIKGIPSYSAKLAGLEEGKMFHTITYGKGLMGQHASQLSKKQRWQVIEWVKCLQKGITAPEFDANGLLKVATTTAVAPTDSLPN
jgi:mono/diheme cytochrome c family protein